MRKSDITYPKVKLVQVGVPCNEVQLQYRGTKRGGKGLTWL